MYVRNRWAALLALPAAMIVAAAAPAPAGAASFKPYSIVICALGASETCAPSTTSAANQPAAVPVGAVGASMTATFTNENKLGSGINVGSVNLTAPSGFSVTNASVNGVSLGSCTPSTPSTTSCIAANTIELRSLGVPPGGTVTASMSVTAPASGCTVASPCVWTSVAKQSNDFSGQPGNGLNVDANTSTLNTVLAHLAFGSQPHSEALGQVITDTDYAPSGGPVTVKAIDANGTTVSSFNGPVSVSLNNAGFAITQGTLGGTTTQNASGGVAMFGDLTVSSPGNAYTLTASAVDLPPSTTSTAFDVAQAGTPCDANKACPQIDATSTNWMTVDEGIDIKAAAASGSSKATLALSVDFGNLTASQCEGYTATHYATVTLSTPRTQTVSITTTVLSGSITGSTINGQELCMASKLPFTEKNETTTPESLSPAMQTTLADGTPGYSGLLADCAPPGKKPTGLQVDCTQQPGVISRSGVANSLGGGTLTIKGSSPFDNGWGG
jgi:hypothetical protein